MTKEAADYWKTQSLGAITSFTVNGVKTMKDEFSCYYNSPYDLWDAAEAQYSNVNFSPATGNHLVVFLPTACEETYEYAGVATMGSGLGSGGFVSVMIDTLHIAVHEFGHNFSLGHANLEVQMDGQWDTDEYLGGYGPQAIAIGNYGPGALDIGYQHVLGVAPASSIRTVKPGDSPKVKLVHVAGTAGQLRGATFTDPGTGERYYIEYRAGHGWDANTFYAHPTDNFLVYSNIEYRPGVRVYRLEKNRDTSTLAPHYPDSMFRPYLKSGQSYTSLTNNFTVKVGSTSATTAEVTVDFKNVETKTKVSDSAATFGKRATVKATMSGAVTPEGKIAFYAGKKKLKTVAVKKGVASYKLPANLRVGKHKITVKFQPSRGFSASSASKTIKVAKAKAKASVIKVKSAKAKKLKKGSKSTITVRMTGVSTKSPTGKVTIKVGKKTVSKAVKLKKVKGKWQATINTKVLPKGKIKIVYSGDKTFKKATYATKYRVS